MIRKFLIRVVVVCWTQHWAVMGAYAVLTVLAGLYAATHLGMDADEAKLLAPDLPFKQAEDRMTKAFPSNYTDLVIVVDAPTPGQAQAAADQLLANLSQRVDLFDGIRQPAGTDFFRHQGLLYIPTADLGAMGDQLTQAQPVLGVMARDPSGRGLASVLTLLAEGVKRGDAKLSDIQPVITLVSGIIDSALNGAAPAPLSIDNPLISNRAILLARPKLDFSELTPGQDSARAIRAAAWDLGLTAQHGYHVRLTGQVALTDDNFASVEAGMGLTGALSALAIIGILAAAVRSFPLVGAILATLVSGLTFTAAFAAATVHTLNPISVAFAVMFIGIAVDFAIQFVVRFRDVRLHVETDLSTIRVTARKVTAPLALASASTAVGFLSFLPTQYTGVSQLGLIAGSGMIIALVVDLTLLPALLSLVKPSGRPEMAGLPLAKPLDAFLERNARPVVMAALALGAIGLALSPWLRFDHNTLDVQNPKSESVRTLFDLARNPDTTPYFVETLTNSATAASNLVARAEALGEVDHAASLGSFVPQEQAAKLPIIADLADIYRASLAPETRTPAPTETETGLALDRVRAVLAELSAPPGSPTGLLLAQLGKLVDKPEAIGRLNAVLADMVPPNAAMLAALLDAKEISQADLPEDLVKEWVTAEGRYKVAIWPKGDMNDTGAMTRFVTLTQMLDPLVTGMPVSMVEAGHVVVDAFGIAAGLAVLAISILLGAMLRRLLDAVLVMVPLILGALYTIVGCVVLSLPINFANIIALPLLLGIGVAFNIYLVVNWRAGIRHHLGTATGRAVLYSALTTASAFGALAVSPHAGTASMGLLLFLSVGLSVATTFLVLPAILHLLPVPPPPKHHDEEHEADHPTVPRPTAPTTPTAPLPPAPPIPKDRGDELEPDKLPPKDTGPTP